MDSIFKISKKGTCGITVTGLEKDNDEYLNDDSTTPSTRNYTYVQSATINAITSINASGEETLQAYNAVVHDIDCIDESDLQMPIDGLYTVTHIIVPNEKWLEGILERDTKSNILNAYNSVYYFNTQNNTLLKYIDGTSEEVSIEELLEVNATAPTDVTEKTTTIIRGDKNTFCLCRLEKCFYTLCKNLLGVLAGSCSNKTSDVKNQIYNRDIIWMALNAIKYLIEFRQFREAQRILEDITQCGGVCQNITVKNTGGGGCGCNKRS